MHRVLSRDARATFDGSLTRLGGTPREENAGRWKKQTGESRTVYTHARVPYSGQKEREREAYCSVRALAGLRHGRVYH